MAGPQSARQRAAYDPDDPWRGRAPGSRISAAFGGVPALDPREQANLRQQQAAFGRVTREIDKQNAWMAVPVLAPELAVAGVELAGALGVRGLGNVIARYPEKPLQLVKRDPFRFNGDNRWARIGRQKHAEFRDRVRLKQEQGWDAEKAVQLKDGSYIRPDAMAPVRKPVRTAKDVEKRYYIGLKPDTPSGRLAGAREVRNYEKLTGNKARIIYYKR